MSKAVYVVEVGGRRYSVEVRDGGEGTYYVSVNGKDIVVRVGEEIELSQEVNETSSATMTSATATIQEGVEPLQVAELKGPEAPSGTAVVTSEIPGRVLKLLVEEGSRVNVGDTVITIESMKMELEIKAPRSGVVEKVYVKTGDTINVGDRIAVIR